MGLGTGATAAIVGGISAAGSLGSAALGANAAGNAASTQSNAALTAAQLQHQDAQAALNFQQQQYNTGQQELAPWLQSGQSGLANLDYLLGVGPNGMPSTTAGAGPGNLGIGSGSTLPVPGARPMSGLGDTISGGGLGHPGITPTGGPINAGNQTSNLSALQGGMPVPAANPQQSTARVQPGTSGATTPVASPSTPYAGQSFNQLVNSGNPQISPNQQTTQQWKAQGIPFQNIITSDGRSVAVRSDVPNPTASVAPPQGIQSNTNALVNPNLGAYGSLNKGWGQTFQAPTGLTEQNDPGYQARLQLGETALNNSAAAKGGVLTGGTARDINQFAQDYASNEYGNVYNRALNTYGTNYNTFQQGQTNQYNRLAALAGIGQQTASQLGTLGQNSANNISNTLLTSGAQTGQQLNNAAAATASGYVGGANAYGGALSGIGGNLSNLASLYSLLNQGGGGGSNPATGGV